MNTFQTLMANLTKISLRKSFLSTQLNKLCNLLAILRSFIQGGLSMYLYQILKGKDEPNMFKIFVYYAIKILSCDFKP